ncbi:FRG domain-containing protein [Vibrio cholerae]|nr:FRG domain-containing protein [Vibrio cholerae]
MNTTTGNGWVSTRNGPLTAEVRCESWSGFIDFIHNENAVNLSDIYCFRGHASENWHLKSTLKRSLEQNSISYFSSIEQELLDSFKKYCLGRRGHNPAQLTENEWWALGQHFGLKTPLLDWSESPYVAAYFAFNTDYHETENVAVWMLAKNINSYPEISRLAPNHHLEFIRSYLDENARLLNQRGLFVRTPFMMCVSDWIAQFNQNGYIALAKVLIPITEKKIALNSLDKMNINHLTLFPDLMGAAEYANFKHHESLSCNMQASPLPYYT